MATYVAIPDTDIDANSPITEDLMFALRDNVLAIQQGDASAPDIQTNAYADLSVTNAKLASNSVTNEKMADNAVGNDELKKSFSATEGVWSFINSNMVIPIGWYMISTTTGSTKLSIKIASVWQDSASAPQGLIFSDGVNVRLISSTVSATHYKKLA